MLDINQLRGRKGYFLTVSEILIQSCLAELLLVFQTCGKAMCPSQSKDAHFMAEWHEGREREGEAERERARESKRARESERRRGEGRQRDRNRDTERDTEKQRE